MRFSVFFSWCFDGNSKVIATCQLRKPQDFIAQLVKLVKFPSSLIVPFREVAAALRLNVGNCALGWSVKHEFLHSSEGFGSDTAHAHKQHRHIGLERVQCAFLSAQRGKARKHSQLHLLAFALITKQPLRRVGTRCTCVAV